MQLGLILEDVGPICIENEFRHPITNPQTRETASAERRCGNDYKRVNDLQSRYAIALSLAPTFTGLGYLLRYRVEATAGEQVIAEAQEAIFGRGILSYYIGLFTLSNNPEYLSCGYAGKDIRVYRNTREGMGKPGYEAYLKVDTAIFRIAVGSAR